MAKKQVPRFSLVVLHREVKNVVVRKTPEISLPQETGDLYAPDMERKWRTHQGLQKSAPERKMHDFKRKIDQKQRHLESLILQLTLRRKQMVDEFKFKEADKLEKSLEFLAAANNNLFMSVIALK